MDAVTTETSIPLTVPRLATRLGLTIHETTTLFSHRPDLAARIVRVGGRRLVMPADIPEFERAVRGRGKK